MEIKSRKINGANAEIEAVIPMETVNKNLEKIAKELAKTTNIQGFRKGKAPVSVIKKQYGQKLIEDAESEALRGVYAKGLEELSITSESLIGEPNISKYDKSDDKIDVVVKIAMRPEIDMGDYASKVKEFAKPTVKEKEIDAKVVELAQNQAPLVDIKRNRKMKLGDTAVMDFEGFIDGEPFEGGKAEGFALLLGSGQFIPGFEDQLVGVKRDEEVDIEVSFPKDYGVKTLAGKDAIFKAKITQIQVKEDVEINAELAEKMLPNEEDKSVEKLKELVKEQAESEALAKLYNETMKPALLDTLVKDTAFDLPDFVVDQEIDMALNKAAGSMSEEEIQELRENADKLKEVRETFRAEAEKSVRATFIIDSLAMAEGVQVDENEVMQTIYYEALQAGQDPKQAFDKYKEAGYIPAIQMSMVEDRVLSAILNSRIKEA